jgi:hypothetical protein
MIDTTAPIACARLAQTEVVATVPMTLARAEQTEMVQHVVVAERV